MLSSWPTGTDVFSLSPNPSSLTSIKSHSIAAPTPSLPTRTASSTFRVMGRRRPARSSKGALKICDPPVFVAVIVRLAVGIRALIGRAYPF
jgi:hypothetical protein